MNGVVDQSSSLGGAKAFGRLVLWGHGDAGIGVASDRIPEGKHYRQGQHGQKYNGIAAQKPAEPSERGRRLQHSLRDINVDGDAAAHGKRASGFEKNVGAFDFGGRLASLRTIGAGEGLSAQSSGGIFGQGHEG